NRQRARRRSEWVAGIASSRLAQLNESGASKQIVDQSPGADQLRTAENFEELARLFDLANVIIHQTDGKILHWTAGCERLYGWTKQEAIVAVVDDLLATKFP